VFIYQVIVGYERPNGAADEPSVEDRLSHGGEHRRAAGWQTDEIRRADRRDASHLAYQMELSDRAEVAGSGAVGPDSFEFGVLGSRAKARSAAAGVGRHGGRSQLIRGVGC
jgi:hypothetical protein